MSHPGFAARRYWPSLGALQALDLGLAVRVESYTSQPGLFCGAERLPVQEQVSELSEAVSGLRVRNFRVRGELEQVVFALMVNVECGFWPQAQRAASDLAGLLSLARQRRLADPELCSRRDKRRFYTMARGSATETAAIVDVLLRRRLAPEAACRSARSLALRVVQMLTRLDAALS